MTIRNPIEWGWAQLTHAASALSAAGPSLHHIQETFHSPAPAVRRISIGDVRDALARGFDDFGAFRTDVVFLCVFYPVIGLVLARLTFSNDVLPLLFPLASGFAIVGPFAALGLYEMSRRREQGREVVWTDAFNVLHSPASGAIAILGLMLVAIFLLWLAAAWGIYRVTLGPEAPASIASFAHDVVMTQAGWTMIGVGMGVGFLFALLAMSISVVSFPLLIDRDVGLDTAIRTSIRAVRENPVPMAVWGLVVAAALVAGSIPLFAGLIIVMPVLGHATWHLYRKLVPR
ncbi:MAG: DUF2189 domain-containing protein [Parvibaculum sp.]|uniref:DUF2189 domain-containing protein n=1 Tax=Parvibaculum sp. TaxID=2024848 RepID=UPI0028443CCD|nr:DUF2189 domain-containing protein [Parvibaculum sp.]MDR3497998.1 DUF2189 domain-containing protein [Parvibaculum sp.]